MCTKGVTAAQLSDPLGGTAAQVHFYDLKIEKIWPGAPSAQLSDRQKSADF